MVYGPAHVAAGLPARYAGRPLLPIQLIESAGSLALVIAGLVASAVPGCAALVYGTGYAALRFVPPPPGSCIARRDALHQRCRCSTSARGQRA